MNGYFLRQVFVVTGDRLPEPDPDRRLSMQKKTSQKTMPVGIHQEEESTRKKKKAPERKESMQALTENIDNKDLKHRTNIRKR